MSCDFDVIIIGSGPAGVSAAFPLLHAGLRVAMVDGGGAPGVAPPAREFLSVRQEDPDQWKWMVGKDFHALRMRDAVSPKFRAPTQSFAFDGFAAANKVEAVDFIAAGSMAIGGLSNAWGCGVARFSASEAQLPFPVSQLDASYEAVARRIGISGAVADDLSDYFGLDGLAGPALPADAAHSLLLQRYAGSRVHLRERGFRMGRSRVAVLSQEQEGRQACNLSGNCLFGCYRGAMYAATHDLPALRRFGNFSWKPGRVVEGIERDGGQWAVKGPVSGPEGHLLRAPRLVVAAGTLATSGLVLRALGHHRAVPLLSSPTAAFLLWLPALLGAGRKPGFGLGQLSFTLALHGGTTAFGSTFATTGLPVSEFARHMPLGRRAAMQVLHHLLDSCVVGNLFLPGNLSEAHVQLTTAGELRVGGRYSAAVAPLMTEASAKLGQAWRKLGGWVLPGSFTTGRPGGDIHYAGTLPMAANPGPGQTSVQGEVFGLQNVFVVDGACLPALPEKSHTLTLMANADRIGKLLASTTHPAS